MVKSRIRAVSFAVTAGALLCASSAGAEPSRNAPPVPSLPPPAQAPAPTAPPVYAPPAEPLPALPPPPDAAPSPPTLPRPGEASPEPDADSKRLGVGLDALLLIPVGRLSDATGVLIGPLLRVGYRITPRVELGLRAGFLFGFNRGQTADDGTTYATSQTLIPIWLGGRYFFMRPNAGLYARAEVGLNLLQGHFHADGDPLGDTSSLEKVHARFGFDVGAGYVLSEKLPIDIHAQFTYLNLAGNQTDAETNASDDPFLGIGIGVGYTLSF